MFQWTGSDRRPGLQALVLAASLCAAPAAWAAEPGVTPDTIRIGMFGPLTGPVSIYGYPINDGAIAVYKQVNDAGGINGRKIEIVQEDDACDPTKARAAVKKLVSNGNVFMVHGGSCSAATFSTRDTFIDEQVPFMVMAATLDKITAPLNHYIFATVPTGTVDGESMIHFVQSMPDVKRVAIVHHTDEWANAKLEAIRKALASGAGLQLVADEVLDRNASDATTQVLKIKDAKPDVVMFVTYPGESAAGPFVGTNSVMDLMDLAQRAGGLDAIRNVYVGAFLNGPVGSEQMKPYADLVHKYFPDDTIHSLPFYGMSGAYAVVEALRRAGPDLTREKFITALETLRDLPAGPSYCHITITPTIHQGCPAQQIWTVRDGHILPLGEKWPGGPLR
jgi:branched-chain amino acid transport system substrate-binding protein